jgi:hypothetical protein
MVKLFQKESFWDLVATPFTTSTKKFWQNSYNTLPHCAGFQPYEYCARVIKEILCQMYLLLAFLNMLQTGIYLFIINQYSD